ncbi:CRISPR-associated endoribonuclease Cas6, partial [Thermodesulfatator indicus]
MRISIVFKGPKEGLTLPVHYNHLVQAFIYRSLDATLASFYHERGFAYGKRRFKLFTFSRLLGKERKFNPEKREITFHGRVKLKISAVDDRLLESFATHLVREGQFRLGENLCEIEAVEVEMPVSAKGPLIVRALSPITIHSTLYTPEGKKKTYFYTPFESEFSAKIFENLMRKARALWGEEAELPPLNGAYIRPFRVSKKNEVIIGFKKLRKSEEEGKYERSETPGKSRNFWIKGWTGLYELALPEPYFTLAYHAGLGA